MSADATVSIPVHLEDARYLFESPGFDPFASYYRFIPGIEEIVGALKVGSLRGRAKVLVYIPSDRLAPGLGEAMRTAIDRYCQLRIEDADREITSSRWDGIKSLWYGVAFLAVCSFLSFLGSQAGDAGLLPKELSYFASEGFLVIGWVSLWRPVEVLLYGWWPHVREKQLYRYIISRTDLQIATEG